MTPQPGLRQGRADLLLPAGDDHGGFGAVNALHNEVHGFKGRHVGDDGIKGQHPTSPHNAA